VKRTRETPEHQKCSILFRKKSTVLSLDWFVMFLIPTD
jgi:hypothetical protein